MVSVIRMLLKWTIELAGQRGKQIATANDAVGMTRCCGWALDA